MHRTCLISMHRTYLISIHRSGHCPHLLSQPTAIPLLLVKQSSQALRLDAGGFELPLELCHLGYQSQLLMLLLSLRILRQILLLLKPHKKEHGLQ